MSGAGPTNALASPAHRPRRAGVPAQHGGGPLALALALALYGGLALLFWGVPVLGHLQTQVIAADQYDSSAYMWMFAWWPHALLHGQNPLLTQAIFVPQGANLTWATSMPLTSLLLAPLTLVFDPAVTFNVVALLAPALSAFTAFLLCRHLTGRVGPALAGGFVFGFSPYELGQMVGAPQLALVAVLPVLVLISVRHLQGYSSRRACVGAMTLALCAQLLISTEILATAVVAGVLALGAAAALGAASREAVVALLGLVGISLLATALLASPILFYTLLRAHQHPAFTGFSLPALSLVLPGHLMAIATHHQPAGEPVYENVTGYVGVPLLVLLGLFARRHWAIRGARLAVACVFGALVGALGGHLQLASHPTAIPLPWLAAEQLPLLRYAVPLRLTVYAFLAAAVVVALWLSWRPRVGHWLLGALAIAFLAPDIGNVAWHSAARDPAFFRTGAYRGQLSSRDRVLTVPVWGPNMRWQARSGFTFALADGYVGPFPSAYTRYPTWRTLFTGELTPGYGADLHRFVRDKGVTAVVVDATVPGPWPVLFSTLGVTPMRRGGILLYRLSRAASASAGSTHR